MNKDNKIVKLKLDIIFKRVFGSEKNELFSSVFLEAPRMRKSLPPSFPIFLISREKA